MGRNSAKRIFKIPGRWQPYTPVGDQIAGTRFISFKVPLKEEFNINLSEVERFTPKDLIAKVSEKSLQLGLVIDFTYTDRYYDSKEIMDAGVEYEKIKTVGHNIPDREIVERFTSVVQKFLEDNADNEKLIGVHCTHGVNRSGYILCRYMIDHLGLEPDAAIEAFNKARGHDLERENYLCELRGGTAVEIEEVERMMEEKHLKEMKPNRTPKRIRKTPPPPRTDKKKRPPRHVRLQSSNEGWSEGGSDRTQGLGMRGRDRGNQGRGFGNHRQPWGHDAYDRHGAYSHQRGGWGDNGPGLGDSGSGFGRPGPMYRNPQRGWGGQRSGFHPTSHSLGEEAPAWDNQGCGFGESGFGWGNQGSRFGKQGPGLGNQVPGLGHQVPGYGNAYHDWGKDIGFVDSDQERIKEAMKEGFQMGVKSALNRGLSRSTEGLPRSRDRNVEIGRRRSGEERW
ncbi:RNA/RNP complex-1-interacting phosphatase-like [Lineus longissimus]|uniref:RNA/RNP complex-1-interacting phosphatase-like n=1 Tax=Lineus longissimus TaxID=88925 RepID=UPI002B4F590D